jgi:hypothetical protein
VDVDKHDFMERRWLTPAHRAALDAGTLNVPNRTQSEHTAVLVSVRDEAEATPVAWIDRGVAEVVHHAARLGAPTEESCENAGGKEGHYGWPPDMAMLWFSDQDGLDRFADLVLDDGASDHLLWFDEPPRRRFLRKRDRGVAAVAIPPAVMPALAAHLRSKE